MKIGDVFISIRNGASIKQYDNATGIPITRIETIANRKVDRNKMGYADIKSPEKYQSYILQDGDILMSHINSVQHLGKTAIYHAIANELIIHGMNLLGLRANTDIIDSEYANYFFNSNSFLRQLPKITKKSVNQASFTVTELKKLEIPCPTLNKQKLIAHRISKLERLIDLRKQELIKLDELVKSRFIEMFGDPVNNSQKRKRVPFSAFMKNIRYGTSQPPVFSVDGEYQFIRATNIKAGKIIPDRLLRISRNEAAKIEKCKLNGGEIIIVRSGVNAGDTCVVTDKYKNQYAGYDIIVSLDLNKANPIYFNILLNTHYMTDVIKPLTIRSAQPHLNSQQVQNLLMLDASIEEQNKFAGEVNKIDKSKLAIQKSLDELETLKKSLMQEYFG